MSLSRLDHFTFYENVCLWYTLDRKLGRPQSWYG